MYSGKVTDELLEAYREYKQRFNEIPDGYDELEGCEGMEYDEFLSAINHCLKVNKEMCDIF